jgi:hypothetical protein
MADTWLVARPDHAQHLLPEREELADDVADALAQGDSAGRGLGLEPLVIGAIDPAVNQLAESAHLSSSGGE